MSGTVVSSTFGETFTDPCRGYEDDNMPSYYQETSIGMQR